MKTLLIGLSCLFVLASCTIGSTTLGTSSGTPVNAQYKTDLDTASHKIKDTQEFADCMAPSVNMCVNSVGMQLAQTAKSVEFCSELSTADQQEGCRFAIVMSLANEKNDPAVCDTLSGNYKEQCVESVYRSQAINTKDISLCEKIGVTASGEVNSGDMMMPGMMSNKKDECVLSVLMSDQATTIADCQKIQDAPLQDMCKSNLQSREMMMNLPQ
ncbi:MAG: hypothetical protein PHY14_04720 [Candidatus Gracilibacteria bacterium]|nr:hypothetical protein [Candidatus Gracilibacteria bacterium]